MTPSDVGLHPYVFFAFPERQNNLGGIRGPPLDQKSTLMLVGGVGLKSGFPKSGLYRNKVLYQFYTSLSHVSAIRMSCMVPYAELMAGLTLRLVFVEYVALRTLDSLIFFLHTYTYVQTSILTRGQTNIAGKHRQQAISLN
jgi:hypothetical protein